MSNPVPGANGPKFFECWGQTKTAKEWVQDPRCVHDSSREIVRRVRTGWSVERALRQPLQTEIPKIPRFRKGRGKKVKAWGITKNISQWSQEAFVSVSKQTLARRISAGWDPECALMARPFESEESARERVEIPPWRRSLGEYLKMALLDA